MASLLSLQAYSDDRLYLFCDGREIKVEATEERFSTVLRLIITDLQFID